MFNINFLEKILAKKRQDDSFISNEELKIFQIQLEKQKYKRQEEMKGITREEKIRKQWDWVLSKDKKALEESLVI